MRLARARDLTPAPTQDVLEVPLGELLEDDGMLEENEEEDLSLAGLFSNSAANAEADRDATARIEAGMEQLLVSRAGIDRLPCMHALHGSSH